MNIFISEISIKNSGIVNPIDKKVIAKIDAETIKIAFIILFAAMILDKYFGLARSWIAA